MSEKSTHATVPINILVYQVAMELEQENYHDIDRIIALPRTTCCASVGAAACPALALGAKPPPPA